MRLGTVCYEGRERVVADLGEGRMLDLHLAAEHACENEAFYVDTLSVICGVEEALALIQSLVDDAQDATILLEDEITFRPPIMPVQYRDCLVFETHLKKQLCPGREDDRPPLCHPACLVRSADLLRRQPNEFYRPWAGCDLAQLCAVSGC